MEKTTQQPIIQPSKNKNIVIVIALVIVVLLALVWVWQSKNSVTNESEGVNQGTEQSGVLTPVPTPLEDTTPVIQQDLQGINDINLDKEFESINTDLNKL